jgi:hypothetical protein
MHNEQQEDRVMTAECDDRDNRYHADGFDLAELSQEHLDGLSPDQQRDLVLVQASALRDWALDQSRRGIW